MSRPVILFQKSVDFGVDSADEIDADLITEIPRISAACPEVVGRGTGFRDRGPFSFRGP